MAQSKYAARFENFFANLRLNRDQFADMATFRAYVKKTERKVIIPAHELGSPDQLALFPKGRAGLTKSAQAKVEDAFTAFLNALDARYPKSKAALPDNKTPIADLRNGRFCAVLLPPGLRSSLRGPAAAVSEPRNWLHGTEMVVSGCRSTREVVSMRP